MNCLNCNKEFSTSRNLRTLFTNFSYKVCPKCLKRYPFKPEVSIIPLANNYRLKVISLYKDIKGLKLEAFSDEFEKISKLLIKQRKDAIIKKIPIFKIEDNLIDSLEREALLAKKNILVLCFHFANFL